MLMDNKEQAKEAIMKAMKEGVSLAKALEIPKSAIEGGYAQAYSYLQAGNYKDAEPLFQMLAIYDMENPRYFLGLGLCKEKQNDYKSAVAAYNTSAAFSALQDPVPLYHAAICYIKLGEKENAKFVLSKIEEIEDNDLILNIKTISRELAKTLNSEK